MTTRKTTDKSAEKTTNQKAAARRVNAQGTASGGAEPAQPKVSVKDLPPEQRPFTLAAADLETQKAASVEQQLATPADSALGAVTAQRVGAVEQAMAQRAKDVQDMQEEADRNAQAEADTQAINAGVADAEVARTPRVPVEPGKDPRGISPDVTSPTTTEPGNIRIPGTGVADPRDLAPGQDLTPSPPLSSSNILPQPNKPGTLYSKL